MQLDICSMIEVCTSFPFDQCSTRDTVVNACWLATVHSHTRSADFALHLSYIPEGQTAADGQKTHLQGCVLFRETFSWRHWTGWHFSARCVANQQPFEAKPRNP